MAYAPFKYNPWEIGAVERGATFVARHALLDQMLAAVREQEAHGTIQHYLLLGPRGIGKTTLLLMLRDAVREDPDLRARWFCVQLREEEFYVYTLRDLFALALEALEADEHVPEAAAIRARVEAEADNKKSLSIALAELRQLCASRGKRLLLLLDNFDRVLPVHNRNDGEFRAFRKCLSTESWLMVIGTSVKVFEEIAPYQQAFFNFFCPVHVRNLDDEEIRLLLRRRAERDDNRTFLDAFEQIEAKIRAITTLTGGNPRLVLMLYDILSRGELLPVVEALRETVDNLTPLLKDVLENLPRQQSKTLDALIRLGGAGSPSDIARTTRLPLNAVTTQLGRLREGGFVESEGGGKGRPATYRVTDQMFRTWYQMRYLRPRHRRIEFLVEFLTAWYTIEERRRLLEQGWNSFGSSLRAGRHRDATREGMGIEYLAASLPDVSLRRTELERVFCGYYAAGDLDEAARGFAELQAAGSGAAYDDTTGYVALGARLWRDGNPAGAIQPFSEAVRRDPRNLDARLGLALCYGHSGEHAKALADFEAVARATEATSAQRGYALLNRGVAKGRLGDLRGEIDDCTAVLELADAPRDQVARALVNRGGAKAALADTQGAIDDFTAAVELGGAPRDQLAKALFNRGVVKRSLGNLQGAIDDYTAVVELEDAPRDHVAGALVNRGVAKRALGDTQGAIDDYTTVVEVVDVPRDQVARALVNRGVAKGTLGDTQGEIDDYTAVVELDDAPRDQLAKALNYRGATRGAQTRDAEALSDFERVLELTGAPEYDRGQALLNRAVALANLGRLDDALEGFEECVLLPAVAANAVLKMARLLLDAGRVDEAAHRIARLSQVELDGQPIEQRLRARIKTVLEAALTVSIEAGQRLLEALLSSDPPELQERLTFLRPALEFARSGDEQALAKLPQDEQEAARRIAASLKPSNPPTRASPETQLSPPRR